MNKTPMYRNPKARKLAAMPAPVAPKNTVQAPTKGPAYVKLSRKALASAPKKA